MVYTIPWDESEPVGAVTPADTIDTELQELKISIRERMNDLIGAGNWEDDGEDPKRITLRHLVISGVNITQDGNGSGTIELTEELNSGEFTTGVNDITFDVDGTFVLWFSAQAGCDDGPDGSEDIMISPVGTVSHGLGGTHQWRVPEHSVLSQAKGSFVGYVTATAGQTLAFDWTISMSVTKTFFFSGIRIVILKVA